MLQEIMCYELVPLGGETFSSPPTKLDLGTSKAFFSKFSTSTSVFFIWDSILPEVVRGDMNGQQYHKFHGEEN